MISVRSFAKINLGLSIGALRSDGFHELRTLYQTIGLHDVVEVGLQGGSGIAIECADSRVPNDATNTCYRVAQRVLRTLSAKGRVVIRIQKRLPVQAGLGAASSNAVATLLALERALNKVLSGPERLRIAAEVGSDLPLFLLGGTILGVGRGEEVYPMPDLPGTPCAIAMPNIGLSTAEAFKDWDRVQGREDTAPAAGGQVTKPKLTLEGASDKIKMFGRAVSPWLGGFSGAAGNPMSGVPAGSRGRGETLLLSLVHTGIENDFEKVVFPKYPELYEIKRDLQQAGAFYASLSGSGSALYGLFRTREQADTCVRCLRQRGIPALATATLARSSYWRRLWK
ncbi:MAG: 4-(cytidine 5'-diphospho)-2-C-methyl-D-erythritol kinase [Acidobacteria bacterium]|nr:4-(cytidine 5'-diphospho)-2-C-methyl-D-erythritol kinase [Acidobacteriota bacterium]